MKMLNSKTGSSETPLPARGWALHWTLLAMMLMTLASGPVVAQILVKVHAEFPTSGFVEGPVFGVSGPEIFDVQFLVDESAAVFYPAGFEVVPGQFFLDHNVYAFGRDAILGSTFSFGTQVFTEPYLHNLSFALLQDGVIGAPMYLSDITPGSTPFIEVGALNVFLGGYDFWPFVFGTPRSVFLTNGAQVYDGIHNGYGSVSVQVSAVPVPAALPMLCGGLGLLGAFRRRGPSAREIEHSLN